MHPFEGSYPDKVRGRRRSQIEDILFVFFPILLLSGLLSVLTTASALGWTNRGHGTPWIVPAVLWPVTLAIAVFGFKWAFGPLDDGPPEP